MQEHASAVHDRASRCPCMPQKRREERPSRATSADYHDLAPAWRQAALLQGQEKTAAVGVVAKQSAVAVDYRVHRATQVGLGAERIEVAHDTLLVGDRDVYSHEVESTDTVDRPGEVGRPHQKWYIHVG